MKFTDLHQGDKARIIKALPDCPDCTRFMEMGMIVDTIIEVKKIAPFGNPIEIEVRGSRLCIRKEDMHCFELEEFSS